MNAISQTFAVLRINLRSLPLRLGNSLVIVIGMACMVAVLAVVFTMSVEMRATVVGEGRADRAIAFARGAENEYISGVPRETLTEIGEAAGIRRNEKNEPIVSGEVVLAAPVSRQADRSDVSITLRGVGAQTFAMRPELKLVAGRMFRPGTQEIIVGAAARAQFANLDIGNRVRLQEGDWTIVGVFAGGRGFRESELMADATTVMAAYKLTAYNTITMLLESPDALSKAQNAIAANANLQVELRSEPEYLAATSENVNRMLNAVAYVVVAIMSFGALFAALNSMHASVVARAVEVAMLRAIGFNSSSAALAILIEAVLLAAVGAVIGIALAREIANGKTISTLGGSLWDSQIVYSLAISPSLMGSAVLLACALGLIGALAPAVRAARANIADALKAA